MRRLVLATSVLLALACPAQAAAAPVVHVGPKGKDSAEGTSASPVRTIGAALKKVADGGVVQVAPGRYPAFRDSVAHRAPVVVQGSKGAVVDGVQIQGAQQLTVRELLVRGPIEVRNHPSSKLPASRVQLRRLEVTAPGRTCLSIRESEQVVLADSRIHHCAFGITGAGRAGDSTGIKILRNHLHDFPNDGIAFGEWDDVEIRSNTIERITTDRSDWHNDAVQLYGGSTGVRIVDNRMIGSRHQLLIMQNATGPTRDVVVERNTIRGAGAIAVQAAGVEGLVFVNNVVAESRWSGLLLRAGWRGVTPVDAVVIGNDLSGFAAIEGARAAIFVGNKVKGQAQAPSVELGPVPPLRLPPNAILRAR